MPGTCPCPLPVTFVTAAVDDVGTLVNTNKRDWWFIEGANRTNFVQWPLMNKKVHAAEHSPVLLKMGMWAGSMQLPKRFATRDFPALTLLPTKRKTKRFPPLPMGTDVACFSASKGMNADLQSFRKGDPKGLSLGWSENSGWDSAVPVLWWANLFCLKLPAAPQALVWLRTPSLPICK